MASKYASYTRLRDIAHKRSERLFQAGLSERVNFPTVKEIKAQGLNLKTVMANIQNFIEAPTKTREYRKLDIENRPMFVADIQGPVVTTKADFKKEQQKAQHRKRNREYRQRVKELTKKQKADLKSAKTLGLKLGPKMAKMFSEYLQYRFTYGNENLRYRIAVYAQEFEDLVNEKKYISAEEMRKDFESYLFNYYKLEEESKTMNGISGTDFDDRYREFVRMYSK